MLPVIPRYYVVAEAAHELQNPTSRGEAAPARASGSASGRSRASSTSRPAAAGRRCSSPSEFGCRVHGVEISPEFHAVARRAGRGGGARRIASPSSSATAAQAAFEPEAYDAALCLGASFVFGGLADTVDALAPAVRPGGHVAVGEPFWRRLPLPEDYEDRDDPWTTLEGTVVDLRDVRPAASSP